MTGKRGMTDFGTPNSPSSPSGASSPTSPAGPAGVPLHSYDYRFNDDILATGAALYTGIVRNSLP
jgi:hypothetical protein